MQYNPLTQFIDKDAEGNWFVADKPVAEAMEALAQYFDAALTNHMDSVAQQRRYDNRITCALRAGFPGPFQAEGLAFAMWMDNCNALAYQMFTEVQQGIRPIPESAEDFIATLPEMEWPA